VKKLLLALAVLSAGAFGPACSCSGNGHVIQQAFVAKPSDDVVHCVCNLSFENEHCDNSTCLANFDLNLCLPQSVRMAAAGVDGGSTDVPDGGFRPAGYAKVVNDYCKQVATTAVYHSIKVFNGGWCDYKKPFAPSGGIGDSVDCFAQERQQGAGNATVRDDGTCEQPCPAVDCDYASNCGGDVQDTYGTIHLDRCKCSQITKYSCPGDSPSLLPTPIFCRAPEGVTLQ